MEIPNPDPQHAPFHEVHLFEILRHRYLQQARAVANIDVYDLILPTQTASVFDQAQDASQGVLTLAGQMCFPWRPKSKKSVQFGDHAYVQFDGTNLKRRWVTAPAKTQKARCGNSFGLRMQIPMRWHPYPLRDLWPCGTLRKRFPKLFPKPA